MIFHLITKADWDALPTDQPVRVASLASEGFIHATQDEAMMLQVANAFYKQQTGEFYLLHIDEGKLTSELKWEAPVDPGVNAETPHGGDAKEKEAREQGADERMSRGTGELAPEAKAEFGEITSVPSPTGTPASAVFPHIYGPINREAIVGMRRAVRAEDGTFTGFAQIDIADPDNPLNLKTPSQMAEELLDATDEFSESLKRFKDRVEGRMAEIDEKIKKL